MAYKDIINLIDLLLDFICFLRVWHVFFKENHLLLLTNKKIRILTG
jgi:hypothetical protein